MFQEQLLVADSASSNTVADTAVLKYDCMHGKSQVTCHLAAMVTLTNMSCRSKQPVRTGLCSSTPLATAYLIDCCCLPSPHSTDFLRGADTA